MHGGAGTSWLISLGGGGGVEIRFPWKVVEGTWKRHAMMTGSRLGKLVYWGRGRKLSSRHQSTRRQAQAAAAALHRKNWSGAGK